MSFSLVEMWASMGLLAKLVVIVLGLMSIWSFGVIAERTFTLRRARRQSIAYVTQLRDRLPNAGLATATEIGAHAHSPVARVVSAAARDFVRALEARLSRDDAVDGLDRTLARLKEREVADLKKGLGGLATVGSTAPFVGLFGTVVGIINAFRAMAQSGSGGLGSVSAGIAEALVTTAFGLLVAIPAVWMFNYFTNRVEGFAVDLDDVSAEIVDAALREAR
jgi:biopolymer transport protein ExbB/TolQ